MKVGDEFEMAASSSFNQNERFPINPNTDLCDMYDSGPFMDFIESQRGFLSCQKVGKS